MGPLWAQYAIGHTTITFQDPSRNNRAIETEIYYPASSTGANTPIAGGTHPVIVFGHGFVMVWSAYQNIWEELVPRGYILAFPRTEGNLLNTNHQRFGWDLQYLVGAMQTQGATPGSVLFGGVAPATALMGHSMGGGAAFLAADSLCQASSSLLKALIGLAPAESSSNGVSSIRSAKMVQVPSLIFSGSQDGVTPPNVHHIPMYDSLASSCKTFINVVGGAHCYFANSNFNCDFGESTSSSGISISRTEQQQVLYDFLNPFLDYWLKLDCSIAPAWEDSLNTSVRITYQQDCSPSMVVDNSVTINQMMLTANATNALYQWYTCSAGALQTPISGATAATYTGMPGGSYAVRVQQHHCVDTSICNSIIGTLISSPNHHPLPELYPNPTQEQAWITWANVGDYQISVHNSTGQLVHQSLSTTGRPYPLSLNNWASGWYVVTLRTSNQVHRLKLLKND